jgi:septal ring factor EnvC (AmiA/AmiB activator)
MLTKSGRFGSALAAFAIAVCMTLASGPAQAGTAERLNAKLTKYSAIMDSAKKSQAKKDIAQRRIADIQKKIAKLEKKAAKTKRAATRSKKAVRSKRADPGWVTTYKARINRLNLEDAVRLGAYLHNTYGKYANLIEDTHLTPEQITEWKTTLVALSERKKALIDGGHARGTLHDSHKSGLLRPKHINAIVAANP